MAAKLGVMVPLAAPFVFALPPVVLVVEVMEVVVGAGGRRETPAPSAGFLVSLGFFAVLLVFVFVLYVLVSAPRFCACCCPKARAAG